LQPSDTSTAEYDEAGGRQDSPTVVVVAVSGDAAHGLATASRLVDGEAAVDATVELGPDEEAEDVGARTQHESEPDGHHSRAEAAVVGLAVQARARAVERDLLPHHGHRHHAPAFPRLVKLLHLHTEAARISLRPHPLKKLIQKQSTERNPGKG
jgi:hypothetical protein